VNIADVSSWMKKSTSFPKKKNKKSFGNDVKGFLRVWFEKHF
jgi:hypothetical protein